MKILSFITAFLIVVGSCRAQNSEKLIKETEVERIIKTLSADDMLGRAAFTEGAEKAASFIDSEFKQIGLQPLTGERGFRQTFYKTLISTGKSQVSVNGENIDASKVLVLTDKPALTWTENSPIDIIELKHGEDFFKRYREITEGNKSTLVFVDQTFALQFKQLKEHFAKGHAVDETNESAATVFILGAQKGKTVIIDFENQIEKKSLFNVAGILPGKSKEIEFVIFSGHYDHLGIVDPAEGDSIANGADDDASGITAVISLAKYFKKLNNNKRTLIFVAFTAEESGGYGSKYFSSKLNPDHVIAMFNIEMIGKESKFGTNSAFITGFEKSNFGRILQRNLKGTKFTFHPDPYPEQNLFYRSDNATLAALGVPAHTISTDRIDRDKFYHTVNDEFETLNTANITATIKAIALSSRSIIAGKDSPKRIPKLKD